MRTNFVKIKLFLRIQFTIVRLFIYIYDDTVLATHKDGRDTARHVQQVIIVEFG